MAIGDVTVIPAPGWSLDPSSGCPLQVKVKVLDGKLPRKGSSGAAGWDVFAAEDKVIFSKGYRLVRLGIATDIPAGHMGLLRPRSELAAAGKTMMGSGIVDSDFRGEWRFSAFNAGTEAWNITKGEAIAQVVFLRVFETELQEVIELSKTQRGESGWGSSDGEKMIDVMGFGIVERLLKEGRVHSNWDLRLTWQGGGFVIGAQNKKAKASRPSEFFFKASDSWVMISASLPPEWSAA